MGRSLARFATLARVLWTGWSEFWFRWVGRWVGGCAGAGEEDGSAMWGPERARSGRELWVSFVLDEIAFVSFFIEN